MSNHCEFPNPNSFNVALVSTLINAFPTVLEEKDEVVVVAEAALADEIMEPKDRKDSLRAMMNKAFPKTTDV